MATPIRLRILAPERALFDQDVQSIVAPGVEGYLGVLARHAPIVTQLGPGVLTAIEEEGRCHLFAVSSGFLEVARDGVTVLTDAAEGEGEIDVERARAAEERARRRLQERSPHIDIARAQAALRRALTRQEVARKSHCKD